MQPRPYSKRPFLVVDVYYAPASHVRTEKPGWAKDQSNWASQDHARVVDRLSTNTLRQASVIIDLSDNTLIKNRFDNQPADEVREHFKRKHADIVTAGLNRYAGRMIQRIRENANRPAVARDMLERARSKVMASMDEPDPVSA